MITGLLEPAPGQRLDAAQTRHMIEQVRASAGSTGEQLTIKNTVPQLAPPAGKSKRGIAIAAAVAVVVVLAVVLVLATNLFGNKEQGGPAAPPESSTSVEPSAQSTPETSENTENTGTADTSPTSETSESSETSGPQIPTDPGDFESALSEVFDPSAGN